MKPLSASHNQTSILNKKAQVLLNEPELNIECHHSINWLGLRGAVEAAYKGHESIVTILSNFAEGTVAAANKHQKYFCNLHSTAKRFLCRTDIRTTISCQLQSSSLPF